MATTKSIVRRHLINKAMEKILHLKNELFKIEESDYLGLLRADESGLASVKTSAGRVPSFSAPAVELEGGVFISIDLNQLKEKDPEMFDALLAKYPTEMKTRCMDTVSVTCTQKCYVLAADEMGITKDELEEIQNKAKQYKVK